MSSDLMDSDRIWLPQTIEEADSCLAVIAKRKEELLEKLVHLPFEREAMHEHFTEQREHSLQEHSKQMAALREKLEEKKKRLTELEAKKNKRQASTPIGDKSEDMSTSSTDDSSTSDGNDTLTKKMKQWQVPKSTPIAYRTRNMLHDCQGNCVLEDCCGGK